MAAAHNILASPPPGISLQLLLRVSNTSIVIGFLCCLGNPCSSHSLWSPFKICPSCGMSPIFGSPWLIFTCQCLTADKYAFAVPCDRPTWTKSSQLLVYLNVLQNALYLLAPAPYSLTVAGAMPFWNNTSTVCSNWGFSLPGDCVLALVRLLYPFFLVFRLSVGVMQTLCLLYS